MKILCQSFKYASGMHIAFINEKSMNNLLQQDFLVYKITNSNLYVAIPNNFSRFIREIVMEYQKLELVPNGRAVKGILFKKSSVKNYEFADQGIEKNIQINSLQFETE